MAAETPSGLVNGNNLVFTSSAPLLPTHQLFADRLNQRTGVDYTYVGNTITFQPSAFPSSPTPGAPPTGTILTLYNQGTIPAGQAGVDNGPGGSRSLASLRTMIRQECDIENDPNIQDSELNTWINQSRYRLYDILIQHFGDDYYTAQAQITTDGVNTSFSLPEGTLYSGAPVFYKGQLVEAIAGYGATSAAPITLAQYNLREKNQYQRPFSSVASPRTFPRYRIMGSNPGNIVFNFLPVGGLVINLWYAPKLAPLLNDADVADDFSGYLEMVIVDCCLKALGKQERDASLFAARKNELIAQIDSASTNRNLAEPNTVVTTEDGYGPFGGMGGGFGGTWM